MTPLPVLVLTAGLGTRLRPLTCFRAKGAVPVNGESLAGRIARWLAICGFTNQVFNLHHHPESITAAIADGAAFGVRVRYSWENPVLGSAGGPRHALDLLKDGGHEHFLMVNGDTLTDVDLGALLEAHRHSGARVTMAVIPNPEPDKYGGVLLDRDGFVRGFSRRGTYKECFHFIGVQVARADVFEALPDNVPDESVARLYPAMIGQAPRSVAAFVSSATFRDIGTPADYLRTSLDLAAREGDRLVSEGARIDPAATLQHTIVWDDVSVGPRTRLTRCIVAGGARIPAGARYANCTIVPSHGVVAAEGDRVDGDLLVRPL